MKFGKLREVVTRGSVRVVYRRGNEIVKDSFRSMDAVPDKFDDEKLQYIAGCDNIMITPAKGDEPVATRGIEARLLDKVSKSDDDFEKKGKKKGKKDKKKDKKKKEKEDKELKEELDIIDIAVDPDMEDDAIDNVLEEKTKDED